MSSFWTRGGLRTCLESLPCGSEVRRPSCASPCLHFPSTLPKLPDLAGPPPLPSLPFAQLCEWPQGLAVGRASHSRRGGRPPLPPTSGRHAGRRTLRSGAPRRRSAANPLHLGTGLQDSATLTISPRCRRSSGPPARPGSDPTCGWAQLAKEPGCGSRACCPSRLVSGDRLSSTGFAAQIDPSRTERETPPFPPGLFCVSGTMTPTSCEGDAGTSCPESVADVPGDASAMPASTPSGLRRCKKRIASGSPLASATTLL